MRKAEYIEIVPEINVDKKKGSVFKGLTVNIPVGVDLPSLSDVFYLYSVQPEYFSLYSKALAPIAFLPLECVPPPFKPSPRGWSPPEHVPQEKVFSTSLFIPYVSSKPYSINFVDDSEEIPSLLSAIKIQSFISSQPSLSPSFFIFSECIDLFGADGGGWIEKVITGEPYLRWGL
jgi:hypothetical protein